MTTRLPPGRAVALDGLITHVRDIPGDDPDAEPALYVHGLGGSGLDWADLAPLLTSRLSAQAIDLPGFGRSEPGRRYGVTACADRTIRWLEESGRGPVHLFGNSHGGTVSIVVAARRPDLVRSLTLISPAMPFTDPRWSEHSRLLPLLLVPWVDVLSARYLSGLDPTEVARDNLRRCYGDPTLITEERVARVADEVRRRQSLPWYPAATVRTFRDLVGAFLRAPLPGGGSLWRTAAGVTAPTMVIAGRRDRLIDIRVAPRVAAAIPDSRLLILDTVGHLAHVEAPGTVAGAVLDFLADR
ncbi:alpha/beta hydrolase [Longispora sp. K20-0274]|uniref:alpha/beta fold hydrolase n=1 Tax=Longispora sp. K20-0274 TaxID=3088255 RepID=UPI0039998738